MHYSVREITWMSKNVKQCNALELLNSEVVKI